MYHKGMAGEECSGFFCLFVFFFNKNIIKYSFEPKASDVPALPAAGSPGKACGTPKVWWKGAERSVSSRDSHLPAGAVTVAEKGHTRVTPMGSSSYDPTTLLLNLRSTKPMNPAYLVSDTVSTWCLILCPSARSCSTSSGTFLTRWQH